MKLSRDRQIEEALNLLDVLEQFSVCLSESEFNVGEIAWEGYLQTITEVKRKLYTVLDNDSLDQSSESFGSQRGGQQNFGQIDDLIDDEAASIVKRIQKLPLPRTGRVRELGRSASDIEN